MNTDVYIVADVMTRQVLTIEVDDELTQAKDLMKEHGIRHLPVIEEGSIVGILSKTDIDHLQYMSDFVNGKVSNRSFYQMFDIDQIMSKSVKKVESDTPIEEAARVFLEHSFHAMPVTEGGELVGMLSTNDLLRCLVDQ